MGNCQRFFSHLPDPRLVADGYTHVECFCPRCRVIRLRPINYLPRISMGLTIAQLSERLRCAECGGQVHSVKPWRMEDVLGRKVEFYNVYELANVASNIAKLPELLRAKD